MSERLISPERFTIAAVCLIGFINATQMANWLLSPAAKQVGGIYPAYFAAAVLASLLCLGGLWFFRRWAALGYVGLLAANQLVLVSMGFWDWHELVVPTLMLGLMARCRRQFG